MAIKIYHVGFVIYIAKLSDIFRRPFLIPEEVGQSTRRSSSDCRREIDHPAMALSWL